tara:strand:- start:113 stop:1918 length:1806 start_codon:yes stop_codon:yes gene_type:complete
MNFFRSITGPILLAILVILSLIDGTAMGLVSKWVPFLGRFHPVLLHLPIGLFAGVVLLEIYLFLRPVSRVPEKIHFLLAATFYTTVFSALFGIFLSWEGGYDSEAVNFHKWAGVVTAAFILGLDWLARNRKDESDKLPTAYLAGLVVVILGMTVTGHQGGSLTHGSGFLTQYNPFAGESANVVEEISTDTPVFVTHIQPIMQDYCFQCHSSEKIKGELRMDNYEFLLAGGVNGPALVPGDSEASDMIHRIHLPESEEDHMPPQGKPQPSEEVVAFLAWWIDQGASETATRDELEITPEIAVHFLEVDVLEFETRESIESRLPEFSGQERLSVFFLAQNEHRIGIRANKATDQDVADLLQLKSNIVELNLGKSEVTDAGLEAIGQMTNLTHLYLNNTAITDAGIEQLTNLYQLQYINLFGTAVTDAALTVLRRLKGLKKIFLWETEVTKEGIASLQKSIFPAVQSDKLRMQIDDLQKQRAALEVDIVSVFDFEEELVEVVKVNDEDSLSISDIMIDFHKGKTSIAAQAQEGKASEEDLSRMLRAYQAMMSITPPKGTVEDWKVKTGYLIEGVTTLLEDGPTGTGPYKKAINCKACHSEHRSD